MNSPNSETIDEQLTAYLDGELSNSERTELELRLVEDPSLRIRLAELRKAVDLLDELPETPHDQQFTKSTLELVVRDLTNNGAVSTNSVGNTVRQVQWFTWPRFLLPLALVLCVGTIVGASIAYNQNQKTLREVSLAANITGLTDANELVVLLNLNRDREVLDLLKEHLLERTFLEIPTSPAERKTWVVSLTPTQLAKLESSREKLHKLDKETYNRFAAIQSQLEGHNERLSLQETVQLVGIVMDNLPNSKRQDLDGLSADQRTVFLREQIFLKAAMHYSTQLPPADAAAIEEWATTTLVPAINAELNSSNRRPNMDIKSLLDILWFRRRVEDGFELDNQHEMVAELINKLSPLGSKLLSGINRNDQLVVLSAWIVPNQATSTQRLLEAYEKINRDVRDEIDLVSPEQSRRLLEENSRRPTIPSRPRTR